VLPQIDLAVLDTDAKIIAFEQRCYDFGNIARKGDTVVRATALVPDLGFTEHLKLGQVLPTAA
jgi:hypothetical protein